MGGGALLERGGEVGEKKSCRGIREGECKIEKNKNGNMSSKGEGKK